MALAILATVLELRDMPVVLDVEVELKEDAYKMNSRREASRSKEIGGQNNIDKYDSVLLNSFARGGRARLIMRLMCTVLGFPPT